jgi:hypothetical protein
MKWISSPRRFSELILQVEFDESPGEILIFDTRSFFRGGDALTGYRQEHEFDSTDHC